MNVETLGNRAVMGLPDMPVHVDGSTVFDVISLKVAPRLAVKLDALKLLDRVLLSHDLSVSI
jgi:hypothetical protein